MDWVIEYLDTLEAASDAINKAAQQEFSIRHLHQQIWDLTLDPLIARRNLWGHTVRRLSEWDEIADRWDAMSGMVPMPRPWLVPANKYFLRLREHLTQQTQAKKGVEL